MKVTVCIGSACHVKGSRQVVEELQYLINENNLKEKVELNGTFCTGECSNPGVCVSVDGKKFTIDHKETKKFFKDEVLARL